MAFVDFIESHFGIYQINWWMDQLKICMKNVLILLKTESYYGSATEWED